MEVVCGNKFCGKTFNYKGGLAHFKRSVSHYCSRSCQNTTHGMSGNKRHLIWEGAKKRAKQNGVIFELSPTDIPEIPDVCPVLEIPIKANDKAGPIDSSPSLDRIHPELGYIVGNVRIISNRANRLRADATLEELRMLVRDSEEIYENL